MESHHLNWIQNHVEMREAIDYTNLNRCVSIKFRIQNLRRRDRTEVWRFGDALCLNRGGGEREGDSFALCIERERESEEVEGRKREARFVW